MYELKNMGRYLRVNLLEPGPRLMEKEFTGPRSQNSEEKNIRECVEKLRPQMLAWGNYNMLQDFIGPAIDN
jgi:hypothetical protein